MKTLKILMGWLVVSFGLLQLIHINIPTPPTPEPGDMVNAPAPVISAIKKGCYDCHSNRNNIPWYGNIAPISFEVRAHVAEGRKWLNFNIFNRYDEEKKQKIYKGIVKTVTSGAMPIPMYLWVHKEARLTPAERKAIIDWAKSHIRE
jgi:hypothetical protein